MNARKRETAARAALRRKFVQLRVALGGYCEKPLALRADRLLRGASLR